MSSQTPTRPTDPVRVALAEVKARQASGEIPKGVTPAARADWAYGNAVIENAAVTRAMAERSVLRNGR